MMFTTTHKKTDEISKMDNDLITIRNLYKKFGSKPALENINLDIQPGHIVGLIGSNSSGKSSLMRHMVGIYLPSTGSCKTLGTDSSKLNAEEFYRIGYVHQEGELPGWMSSGQLIRYVASHYPGWNEQLEQKLVDYFGLALGDQVSKLSPGQRQKLSILLAVCFEPELLILDEPASALDPIARKKFLEFLLDIIQDQERTIIISSHILSDIEKVIDHVLVLDHGELIRDCSFDTLLEEFLRLEVTAVDDKLPAILPLPGILECERDDYRAVVVLQRPEGDLQELASRNGLVFKVLPLTLEEIYPLVIHAAPTHVTRPSAVAGVYK